MGCAVVVEADHKSSKIFVAKEERVCFVDQQLNSFHFHNLNALLLKLQSVNLPIACSALTNQLSYFYRPNHLISPSSFMIHINQPYYSIRVEELSQNKLDVNKVDELRQITSLHHESCFIESISNVSAIIFHTDKRMSNQSHNILQRSHCPSPVLTRKARR